MRGLIRTGGGGQSPSTTDSSGNSAVNAVTYETGLIAGERNVDDSANGYQVVRQECNLTVCDSTGAIAIGGGSAGDTHLMGILIMAAATPVTATIAGFEKTNSTPTTAAATIVLTGADSDLTTGDRFINFYGAINSGAALTVTASVDEKVIVFWKSV